MSAGTAFEDEPRLDHPRVTVTPWVMWWAMVLAADVETFEALLRGEHVDPGRLRPMWLARAKALQLVRLDTTAIDELFKHGVEPYPRSAA